MIVMKWLFVSQRSNIIICKYCIFLVRFHFLYNKAYTNAVGKNACVVILSSRDFRLARKCATACRLLRAGAASLGFIYRSLGLHRRVYSADVDMGPISEFIEAQLKESGRLHGYRWMYNKCQLAGFQVTREIVRQLCKHFDPVGVELRKKRRLSRRSYFAKGPNYIWHLDGYDKIKPFGICINGCIDGFSRQIIWLKASTTNNNPDVIGKYFLDVVLAAGGCPRVVRADFGTENVRIREFQVFLRRNAVDERSGANSYIDGASTSNQRIESWWGFCEKKVQNSG